MDSSMVMEFICKEVSDWNEEVIATARFKAFSGQRSDWEPKYQFWRNLILKIARHLGLFTIRPCQVKNEWFNRGGLTPLCLDHVLFLMYTEGDIIRNVDVVDATSGRFSQLYRKVTNLVIRSTTTPDLLLEDNLILTPLLKEKADQVIKLLSENHWTTSCVVTMRKFQDMCGGPNEASVVLSYFSGVGKAQYLSVCKKEFVEGIKVSLSSALVPAISSLDFDVLHLIWTAEKLQQQIDVIDQRYELSRNSALAYLKSGNKKMALRHARDMKLASDSREKCTSLFNRVEEVLNIIADAESTKKVTEAIQIGAQAMKQNKITVEEVDLCLEELEENIDSQKQVEKALESTPSYTVIEDEDIEEEFKKLEMEVGTVDLQSPVPRIGMSSTSGETDNSVSTDSLSDALSNLKLQDALPGDCTDQVPLEATRTNDSKNLTLEAA
ncbi:charged multivesicular body protein 7 [Ricinus communis]|uniref:Protein CHMP7, putative n=1 Tax=Ricinus communis TaxID=3988 RepID=B9RN30_RICCO|nr:charged multivesicular body protein 7 [Ricinus communis]EEF47153.1 Protein CHMP7, putative [Ricinus communis]|eukprot:XP_002515169.1 charged multivesicular body protein 7 [Ricinus communis]